MHAEKAESAIATELLTQIDAAIFGVDTKLVITEWNQITALLYLLAGGLLIPFSNQKLGVHSKDWCICSDNQKVISKKIHRLQDKAMRKCLTPQLAAAEKLATSR